MRSRENIGKSAKHRDLIRTTGLVHKAPIVAIKEKLLLRITR